MSMKKERDRLSEIAQIKGRRATTNLLEIAARIDEIERNLSKHGVDIETLKYFPVALVTVIEVHTKAYIQALVDGNEEAALRAETTIKFEPRVVLALVGKKVSFGEIIAHSFTARSLLEINAYISKLIDRDYLETIKKIDDKFMPDRKKESGEIVLENPSRIFKVLNDLFELRHIVVHEIPKDIDLDRAAISDQIQAARMYLRAANVFLHDEFVKGYLELEKKNEKVTEDLTKATDEFLRHTGAALTTHLAKRPKDDQTVKLYRRAHQRWKAYQTAELAWIERLLRDEPFGQTNVLDHQNTMKAARAGMLFDILTDLRSAAE
jgi:hypothetical protein